MRTDRVGARLLAIALGLLAGGCSDGPERQDALGPDPSGPAAPIVSDPVSAPSGTSFSLTGSGFVYVSLQPGTVPGATSASIANARTGTSFTLGLADGGLDPVALPASVGDTIAFTIHGSSGGSPTSVGLVVPAGLRPSVVRTYPPARRDQPMLSIVRVIFSEPMNPVTITGATVQILLNGSPLSGQVQASADGLSATLELDEPLAPLTEYTLFIGASVADSDGETLGEPITVTFSTGTSAAELPPGVLAHTSAGLTIRAVNTDGTGGRTLVARLSPDSFAMQPAWSPDGRRLAFVQSAPAGSRIYAVSADGTNRVQLSSGADFSGSDSYPSWSPDGSRIAFSREGPRNGIFVVNQDGTNLVQLSVGNHSHPSWSPDGNRIVHAADSESGDASTIHVMNPDGTNHTNVTNADAQDGDPAWSPDGTRIAFRRSAFGGGPDLFVMDADGANLARLTTFGDAHDPTWSPDGSMIAFTKCFQGWWDYGCTEEIWIVRLSNGHLFRLAWGGQHPAWRP
jgi:hypothetical protein